VTPNDQALTYVYFGDETGRQMAMHQLTRDQARRIAANIAQLPELLQRQAAGRRRASPTVEWAGPLSTGRREKSPGECRNRGLRFHVGGGTAT